MESDTVLHKEGTTLSPEMIAEQVEESRQIAAAIADCLRITGLPKLMMIWSAGNMREKALANSPVAEAEDLPEVITGQGTSATS